MNRECTYLLSFLSQQKDRNSDKIIESNCIVKTITFKHNEKIIKCNKNVIESNKNIMEIVKKFKIDNENNDDIYDL